MFTDTQFIITKRQKQSSVLSVDEWINTTWSIHTVEYYSAMKRNGALTHATMRMNLEHHTE